MWFSGSTLAAVLFGYLAIALLLVGGIGLAVLYSAGGEAQGMHLMLAQGARFAAGLAAMWGLSRVTPTRLRAWTPGAFLGSLALLVLVLFVGGGKHGPPGHDLAGQPVADHAEQHDADRGAVTEGELAEALFVEEEGQRLALSHRAAGELALR